MLVGVSIISFLSGAATCFIFCQAYIKTQQTKLNLELGYIKRLTDNEEIYCALEDLQK